LQSAAYIATECDSYQYTIKYDGLQIIFFDIG